MRTASQRSGASTNEALAALSASLGLPLLDRRDVVSQRSRIIEVGSDDFTVGKTLAGQGCTRYLALARTEDGESLERIRASHPELRDRIFALAGLEQLLHNNADVLIVSDPALTVPPKIHRHRYLSRLLWLPPPDTDPCEAASQFASCVRSSEPRGRLRLVGVCALDAGTSVLRPAVVAEIHAPKKPTARHYISPRIGIEGFLRKLELEGARYVVLRWFDELPNLPIDEDLDLLIADEHAGLVCGLLADEPGLIPCDLYSVSGLPGTAYRNMAYYPPPLAEQILAGARQHERGFWVPDPRGQFRSLAYHALYHKGEGSGLSSRLSSPAPILEPEHDYAGTLAALATELGLRVRIAMEDLDDYLASQGWRPPMDTLGRLARKNGWIARRLADLVTSGWEAYRGLTVFIIRKRAVDLGYHDAIVEQIRSAGFHIVKAKTLPAECVREVSRHARGGNWSTGPWPTSGGPPAVAVAAFDSAPIEPTPAQCEKHPGLENARVLVKAEIRDRMNERLLPSDRCNVIHSSDNAWGAREYVQLAFAEEAADVLAAVTRLRGSHQAPAHGCELRRQP